MKLASTTEPIQAVDRFLSSSYQFCGILLYLPQPLLSAMVGGRTWSAFRRHLGLFQPNLSFERAGSNLPLRVCPLRHRHLHPRNTDLSCSVPDYVAEFCTAGARDFKSNEQFAEILVVGHFQTSVSSVGRVPGDGGSPVTFALAIPRSYGAGGLEVQGLQRRTLIRSEHGCGERAANDVTTIHHGFIQTGRSQHAV